MSLLYPPPAWAYCTTNISGTPSNSPGTAITAGASSADGSSVALLTNLSHDVEYFIVGFRAFNAAAADCSTLVDILIDPAGGTSWLSTPLIGDLLGGKTLAITQTQPFPVWYHFPIWLKSGCSIGARARNARAATTAGGAIAIAYGGNRHPSSWWCGQEVTSVGIASPSSSRATNHTAGVAAFSSWADFGSPLPKAGHAVQFGVGNPSGTADANVAYHFEFGIGGNIIGPPIYKQEGTAESGFSMPTGPIFASLAEGAQLQVRAIGTSGVQAIDVAAYVVH